MNMTKGSTAEGFVDKNCIEILGCDSVAIMNNKTREIIRIKGKWLSIQNVFLAITKAREEERGKILKDFSERIKTDKKFARFIGYNITIQHEKELNQARQEGFVEGQRKTAREVLDWLYSELIKGNKLYAGQTEEVLAEAENHFFGGKVNE